MIRRHDRHHGSLGEGDKVKGLGALAVKGFA